MEVVQKIIEEIVEQLENQQMTINGLLQICHNQQGEINKLSTDLKDLKDRTSHYAMSAALNARY